MTKNHIEMVSLSSSTYPQYRAEISQLYIEAFTMGEYAQSITFETATHTLDKLIESGFGYMVFSDDLLIGVLIATPLSYDREFPKEQASQIDYKQAIYIAEVMVNSLYQGKGIASMMIKKLINELSKDLYHDLLLRVWDDNMPAVHLYRNLGFNPIAHIVQQKTKVSGEQFEMKKTYMHKKL